MPFYSILTDAENSSVYADVKAAPEFFQDLNLDQVIEMIVAGREEYHLRPFFYCPVTDVKSIGYRHEVFVDLEEPSILACLASFGTRMKLMRSYLAQGAKMHYKYQRERWFLDAAAVYCEAVSTLTDELARTPIHSRGLQGFNDFLVGYTSSTAFSSLKSDTFALSSDLSEICYCVQIKGNRVQVSRYENELDYSAQVEATFAKFKQGDAADYRVGYPNWPEMDHVEAKILELVARLFPETFGELEAYCNRYQDYLNNTISSFDREVQFYLAYVEYMDAFKAEGLHFTLPQVNDTTKEINCIEAFDLALARKLLESHEGIVTNDFHLSGNERIIVVTGPNQGGKTTFARMFGQLHYLASIGCPVPAKEAQLFLYDRLFTHFPRQEQLDDLTGKLEDDLLRIREILLKATPETIIIMNEIFNSTTVSDALFLGQKIMEKIVELDLVCVYVTFLDELSTFSDTTVSMASTVAPFDPTQRTYKILRRSADGLAYAIAIAEKYGLTYERLKGRIRS